MYSPYSEVGASEHFVIHNPLMSQAGFKGLFFDRFITRADYPPLTQGSEGVYQSRNRSCIPRIGHTVQRDSNAATRLVI